MAQFRSNQFDLSIRDASRLWQVLSRARKGIGKLDEARFLRDIEFGVARNAQRILQIPEVINYPDALPVTQARQTLVQAFRAHPVVVVCGETGSGKSTQLPKMLMEAGFCRRGLIGHTQPRRLAARALASRVAAEMGDTLGGVVGYETRFDRRLSERTLIKLMTDGILLAELGRDRWLEQYEAIIIDEAHERTLNIDFLLGRLKQIVERRRDLRIVITSATLDPERLSAHFNGAPIITVEGRTFPVEMRYSPAHEDEEMEDHVARAIDNLWRPPARQKPDAEARTLSLRRAPQGGVGDTLVFLPGEREINELVRVLGGRFPHAQVLPLYTRLPVAQQDKVFATGGPPKIVCTTNVAETSVTVPGVRYVVDLGTARVNRFAPRLGVQHLEIEPVSQAAANQRAGRCGRVGPGVCVRLYAEDDFLSRESFTDPEIKRVNLAGVLLQMAALNLGDIEAFPWIDPPDSKHIADGLRVLNALGAIDDDKQITELGRELARLPLDPRVARIALAGRGTPAADPIYVLAAALSIQDPHEVPPDEQTQARQKHAEWRDDRSDFLTLLGLWRRWMEWTSGGTKRGLRRMCEAHYVSFIRMQEWDALYRQIVDLLEGRSEDHRRLPALPSAARMDDYYEPIHKALLAGLIDQISQKKPEPVKKEGRTFFEYLGPRGRRLRIFPGSALAKKTPDWIVSAQLAQTTQLFARTNAAVQPEWLADVGAHLVKRSVSHPQWNSKRGEVAAMEQVSLLGMPLMQQLCHYGSHHPAEAREIFIRDGLVRGQMLRKPAFLEHNLKLIEEIQDKETRMRRPDLLGDENQLHAFYDARLPEDCCTLAALTRFLKMPGNANVLTMGEDDALRPGANPNVESLFPDHLTIEGVNLPVDYIHDPSSNTDGISVRIPLARLHSLTPEPFNWLVPGLRPALFEALIRTLPNDKRRRCTPAAAWAQALHESISPEDGPLLPTICVRFRSMIGVELEPEDFAPQNMEAYLRPRFIVEDEQGEKVAEGDSLLSLQEKLREGARAAIRAAATAPPKPKAAPKKKAKATAASAGSQADAQPDLLPDNQAPIQAAAQTTVQTTVQAGTPTASVPPAQNWQRDEVKDWDFADLPKTVVLPNGAPAAPALTVEGDRVALRLFESQQAAAQAQHQGRRALLLQKLADRSKDLRKASKKAFGMSLIGTPLTPESLIEDLLLRIADEILGDSPAHAKDAFEAAVARRQEFSTLGYQRLEEIVSWLAQSSDLRRKLGNEASAWPDSAADLRNQLETLFAPGFVTAIPAAQWPRINTYLKACTLRFERLANKPQRDLDNVRLVAPLAKRLPSSFHPARWVLEELRVQLFAQELKAVGAPTLAKVEEAIKG